MSGEAIGAAGRARGVRKKQGGWSSLLGFLQFGANSDPGAPRLPFYRHALLVRITHWLNAGVLLVMLMSGLQIFNAHPALYWGAQSDFTHPLLSFSAFQNSLGQIDRGVTQLGPWHFDTTGVLGASWLDGTLLARAFPAWATLPGPQWLAMGRVWHFFFAWLFVINGGIFAFYALTRGHIRDLTPTARDIRALPHDIMQHAKLRFPKGEAAKRYNALQKLAYFTVVFVLGPLVVLTGLTMSPTMDAAFPFLPWIFDGRQSARTIHFICAFSFLGFFMVHIIMVVLSGTWNNIRSMITGRYLIEAGGEDV
ncbi:MAG: cytochrome b/b6 domain-containing protein [Sinobacteraceae bacterium]|nr:cytochrome b/b6 domain-containing protein [Nevskiaceae bacterium]